MAKLVACLHGHVWQVADEVLQATTIAVCPWCGAVVATRRRGEVPREPAGPTTREAGPATVAIGAKLQTVAIKMKTPGSDTLPPAIDAASGAASEAGLETIFSSPTETAHTKPALAPAEPSTTKPSPGVDTTDLPAVDLNKTMEIVPPVPLVAKSPSPIPPPPAPAEPPPALPPEETPPNPTDDLSDLFEFGDPADSDLSSTTTDLMTRAVRADRTTDLPQPATQPLQPATAAESAPAEATPNVEDVSSQVPPPEEFAPPEIPNHEILGELGRGAMGIVYRARDRRLNREVALKTMQKIDPVELQRFKDEFRALADIKHENLIALNQMLSHDDTWCFTMEVISGVKFHEYVWSEFRALERRPGGTNPAGNSESDAERDGRAADNLDTLAALRNEPRLTPERLYRLRHALRQLATGLAVLHQKGTLHRDIKPSNIMVTRDGRVVLLDFGLAAKIKSDSAEEGRDKGVFGTVLYVSPEQAANSEALTGASDWYSVGVMLYELLTGRPPFTGDMFKVLIAKQHETPLPPKSIQPTVPDDLNDVCLALLNPLPEKRPSALEVLQRLQWDEGLEWLADAPTALEKSADGAATALVGRETHLRSLHDHFTAMQAGEANSVFVHGRSGMGKSILLRRFLDDLAQQARRPAKTADGDATGDAENADDTPSPLPRIVVLEGRCYEQESVPFKALDSLIDSLGSFLMGLSREQVQPFIPRDIRALIKLFPVLGQIQYEPDPTAPSLDRAKQEELRQRGMIALRELLTNIGQQVPLVLHIDDLQWGDTDSAALLADLVRPPHAPRLLLLGSYRSEDADRSHFLRALHEAYQRGPQSPPRQEIAVEALLPADAERLARMLLQGAGAATDRLAAKLARESGGSPFFVWELVNSIKADPAAAERLLETKGNVLDEVIWNRAGRLTAQTRRLLEVVAVAGRPLAQADVYHTLKAADYGPESLAQLRANHFVRSAGPEPEDVVEAYHDRIRESVVAHLDVDTRQNLHRKLAKSFQERGDADTRVDLAILQKNLNQTRAFELPIAECPLSKPQWQRVFDIAYHYDAAGEHAKAFPFALAAAERAWRQHALEVAEQQYRIALRAADHARAAMRFRVAEGLGDVLMARGHYPEAKKQFEVARQLATGESPVARINAKLGEVAFKQGNMSEGSEHVERALAVLGRPAAPKRMILLLPKVAREALAQVLHSLLPKLFVGRRKLDTAAGTTDLLASRLYTRLSYAYWFNRGKLATFWAHLRGMNLGELYPPSLELAHAYSLHGPVMSMVGWYDRGVAYAKKSLQIREENQDLWGQGQSLHFLGVVLFAAGRFDECIDRCRHAVRLLDQAGDPWESNMARYHIADALYRSGDLGAAVAEARRVHRSGVEVGDTQSTGVITIVWAAASRGQMPEQIIERELACEREDPLATIQVVQAKGMWLMLNERAQEAIVEFEKALAGARASGLQNAYVAVNYAWLATSQRLASDQLREFDPAESAALLRRAAKAARKSWRMARTYPNDLPHALREIALCAVRQNRPAQARLFFDRSLAVAEKQNARYEAALTRWQRALAGRQFHWSDAAAELKAAQSLVQSIEQAGIAAAAMKN